MLKPYSSSDPMPVETLVLRDSFNRHVFQIKFDTSDYWWHEDESGSFLYGPFTHDEAFEKWDEYMEYLKSIDDFA